ncbi:MAG: LemA family protein [bacterium]
MTILIGFFVILILIGGLIWFTYNTLIVAKTRVDESWSGIDVQLKRRADLIPNLVESVKAYAKHEKGIFEKVSEARSALMGATSPNEKASADNALTGALKSLFAIVENYPDLKASGNFKELQDELSDTENKIAYSRQFYNSNVLDFNTKIKVVPTVFIANMLKFKPVDFFKAEDADKKEVKVAF